MKSVSNPSRAIHRRGATLVELLIVMSVLCVVLTTSTMTLFRLLHAQSAGTAELAESLTVSRLAHDFRRDAHAAATALLINAGADTRLTFSGGPAGDVVYTSNGPNLQRRVQSSDGTAIVEDYRLGVVTVELVLSEGNRLASVQFRATAPNPAADSGQNQPLQHRPPRAMSIDAAVSVGQ